MKRKLGGVAVALLGLVGCEWPWQRSELELRSTLWTDQIGATLRLEGVSAELFGGCPTHQACAEGFTRALAVPTTAATLDSKWAGELAVQMGAKAPKLRLERSDRGLDVVIDATLPSNAPFFQGRAGLWLEGGGRPQLYAGEGRVLEPKGVAAGERGFRLDLTDAPARVVIEGPGSSRALPVLMALPGLEIHLTKLGLIPPP
jgi:hypothetical protein